MSRDTESTRVRRATRRAVATTTAALRRTRRSLGRLRSPSPLDERWERVRAWGLFDADWYRTAYPDVSDVHDLLRHYAVTGWRQGRDPNPMFRTSWYLTTYPDVAAAGGNPLLHFVEHGAAEGRDPGPDFDTSWYLRANADVRASGLNPLGHYLTAGLSEGRRPRPVSVRSSGERTVRMVLVSGEPETPGHQYRVARLADAVRRIGGDATVLTIPEAAAARIAEIDGADVVVLWRAAWCPEVERIVRQGRRAGAVIVFDVDDLMVDPAHAEVGTIDGIRSQGLTEAEAGEWFGKVGRTASESDACFTTTPTIARALRGLGKPVFVLPNGFDDDTMVRSRLARRVRALAGDDGLCRIGYAAGSLTHQRDFAVAARPLADVLSANPETRLVLFRGAVNLDEFPAFDALRGQVEWRSIVPLDLLPVELARLDVNIAPLEVENIFCEAKSGLKFFEAALVDVPTVASPTAPYRALVDDGVTGFLANDDDDWRRILQRLVSDSELRSSVGVAARRSTLWPLGPERRAQVVGAILDQLLRADAGPDAFELELVRAGRPAPPTPATAPADIVFERDRGTPSRVTVVVPVHDYAEVVTDALDSVRDQTLHDLDLVVVDDGSTDDSRAVTEAWLREHAERFNRVLLVAHRENAGVARARNMGFDLADTPYVLPLDADNVLLPRCCEALLGALERSSAVFAYPRIRHFGGNSELFVEGDERGYLPYSPQRLVGSNYIDAMALVRKGAWAGVGGYRQGTGWEDYDLWCRFAEHGLAGVQVDEELARYRVHPGSMLHSVTHAGTTLAATRAAIAVNHPWLDLEPPVAEQPIRVAAIPRPVAPLRAHADGDGDAPARTGSGAGPEDGRLSERGRLLLPLMRCPETGEALEEDPGGGIRSVASGRRWPVADGRPIFLAADEALEVFPDAHEGNPLPRRARDLIAGTGGHVLHLSGGGTTASEPRVVELDGALFGPTDVVGDAHRLPFGDGRFELVIAMNAFEHYRAPTEVVREIRRVLRPGGLVFVHTAFLQPLHEAPRHYFNCTRYGLEEWFSPFQTLDLRVSENFHPGFALAWLASEAERAVQEDHSDGDAALLRRATIGAFSDLWRDPSTRGDDPRWALLAGLSASSRERLAAGFEYLGRSPS